MGLPRGAADAPTRPLDRLGPGGAAALSMTGAGSEPRAPVAVRTVELDTAADLDLTRNGEPYRSALLIGLRDGAPVGTASASLAGGPLLPAATTAALFAEARSEEHTSEI